jgi:HEAT repeat protein
LGKISRPEGIPTLAKLAGDEDPVVRWHVAVALGDIGHPDGVAILLNLLKDSIPFVRGHAGIGLAQIGDQSALDELQAAARVEPHPKMKSVLEDAARLLESSK